MRSPSLIAVCGLHGGAGTTSLARLLADALAGTRAPGAVLLTETDPIGGGLAAELGARSAHSLSELAFLRQRRMAPAASPFADLPCGVRLLAGRLTERPSAPFEIVSEVLAEAHAAHQATVVDCGTLREPHGWPALTAATHVIWVARATASSERLQATLASPLARPAQTAPWILAVTAGDTASRSIDALRAAAPTAHTVVLVPDLTTARGDLAQRELAAANLLSALS